MMFYNGNYKTINFYHVWQWYTVIAENVSANKSKHNSLLPDLQDPSNLKNTYT